MLLESWLSSVSKSAVSFAIISHPSQRTDKIPRKGAERRRSWQFPDSDHAYSLLQSHDKSCLYPRPQDKSRKAVFGSIEPRSSRSPSDTQMLKRNDTTVDTEMFRRWIDLDSKRMPESFGFSKIWPKCDWAADWARRYHSIYRSISSTSSIHLLHFYLSLCNRHIVFIRRLSRSGIRANTVGGLIEKVITSLYRTRQNHILYLQQERTTVFRANGSI
jgi:hypothetical protein